MFPHIFCELSKPKRLWLLEPQLISIGSKIYQVYPVRPMILSHNMCIIAYMYEAYMTR